MLGYCFGRDARHMRAVALCARFDARLDLGARLVGSLLAASLWVGCEDTAPPPASSFDATLPPAVAATPDAALDASGSSSPPSLEDPSDAGGLPDARTANDAATGSADGALHTDAGALAPDSEVGAIPGTTERTGDFAVGTRRIEIMANAGRVLPVQLWYPTLDSARDEAQKGHSIEDFEQAGARRALITGLIKDARMGCPNLTMRAALDAAPYPRGQKFPLVLYSHHFSGSRFSMFSIAEGLAQRGMVVAAPDHVNGSLFEREDVVTDALTQLNDEFLQTRVADLKRVLDVLLDEKAEVVPQGLRGRLDAAQVGAMGHSWGGITVGIFSVNDARVKASAYLAIPPYAEIGTLLVTIPTLDRYRTPGLYVMASEDVVTPGLGGNEQIVADFEGQSPPAWLVELHDAGHFSFADDCALVAEFEGCCGSGERVADSAAFTYVEPKLGREVATRYAATFFAAQLQGASAAPLNEATPPGLVVVKQHGAKSAKP